VFAGIEGTRPVLVEIQALVAPSSLGTPRRAVVGWDMARLNMVMAVLEARAGLAFGGFDIYLNVAGGLRISEPAADLAVAAALVSAFTGDPVPADAVVFGEIGLSGEVRAVALRDLRLKEAAKLGFQRAWLPRIARKAGKRDEAKAGETKSVLALQDMGHVQDVVSQFANAPKDKPKNAKSGAKDSIDG
jgi:DNA repair protein RadA/Sms